MSALPPSSKFQRGIPDKKCETRNCQVNISGLRAAIDVNRALGRRLLWVFLLTICFAVMLVQMTDRVRHYLSEPVAVQVSVARNTSLTYPAITICNKVREHACGW